MQSGQWSLLLVDLIGAGAVVVALAYGISSFGNIFAKWSDLTISDQTCSRFNRLAIILKPTPRRPPTASMTSEGKYYRAALNFRSRFERGAKGAALVQ